MANDKNRKPAVANFLDQDQYGLLRGEFLSAIGGDIEAISTEKPMETEDDHAALLAANERRYKELGTSGEQESKVIFDRVITLIAGGKTDRDDIVDEALTLAKGWAKKLGASDRSFDGIRTQLSLAIGVKVDELQGKREGYDQARDSGYLG